MITWALVILLASQTSITTHVVKEYNIYSDCKEDLAVLQREAMPKPKIVVSMACEPSK